MCCPMFGMPDIAINSLSPFPIRKIICILYDWHLPIALCVFFRSIGTTWRSSLLSPIFLRQTHGWRVRFYFHCLESFPAQDTMPYQKKKNVWTNWTLVHLPVSQLTVVLTRINCTKQAVDSRRRQFAKEEEEEWLVLVSCLRRKKDSICNKPMDTRNQMLVTTWRPWQVVLALSMWEHPPCDPPRLPLVLP